MGHRLNPFFQEKIKQGKDKATTKLFLFSLIGIYIKEICSAMNFEAVLAFKGIKCMHVGS